MIRKILLASLVAVGMSSCTVAMMAAPALSSALASPPGVAVAR